MSRHFSAIKKAAERERRNYIDPRHEELPIGDWPGIDFDPITDARRSGGHKFSASVISILLVFVIAIILIAALIYVLVPESFG